MVTRRPLVYIPVGLPGCGKTTWARKLIEDGLASGAAPGALVRVSRDDYRRMLTVGYRDPVREFEDVLTRVRDTTIMTWLHSGADVIVDECNLNPVYFRELVKSVEFVGADWHTVEFTGVPLETCIARDAQRTGAAHVGEQVIRDLHARYLADH